MDDDIVYLDMAYCTLCDRYFPGSDARRHHVQVSTNHPKCDTCDRRFANMNALRNHLVISPRHNYCRACEQEFKTPAGLRVHIEYSAIHRDDSDDDSDDEEIDDSEEGWEDAFALIKYPNESEPVPEDSESDPEIDVDYWTDDDQTEFEEDLDAYDGFARSARTESDDCPGKQPKHEHRQEMQSAASSAAGVLVSCPLCLEAPTATSATRCGHIFCTSCIKTALSKKKMCPVCRDFSSPKDLRKIYLPGSLMATPSV
ncbi:hypothetical protein BC629DRAFT_1293117 [Irpex lacteus]|nr:hypothetical protein BC629DRAFT_1293117 [Irpex lacteus]